jgi:gliding motility-associated-like protein
LRFLPCFLLLFLAPALRAQIVPPDFTCTNAPAGQVELIWSNVTNNCGPYQATEIYRAGTAEGPFTLLTELTDPTATTYLDPNPAGALRYYYLRYRYDCPGQTAMNSDTLENLIPVTPVLQFIGVEEDEIVIDWLASRSPEVTGYIILEVTPTAFIPLDTVFDVTDFRLPFTAADGAPEDRRFRLVAIDACGNDSPQSPAVSVARLSGSGGSGCTNVVTLDVDQERIAAFLPRVALALFVSLDGGPFVAVGNTFSPAATTLPYQDANDGDQLCFYVEAVLGNNQGRARSAIYCQAVTISQPIRDFPLYGVEVDEAGNLLFQFADDDPNQPAPTASELLLTRIGNTLEFAPLLTPVFGSGGQLTFPPLAEAAEAGETFQFRLTDECMREVTTNAVEPVYLTVNEFIPGNNRLSWTPLINNLPGDINYDVFRVDAAGNLVPVVTGLTETNYTDVALANTGGEVCYLIRARFQSGGAGPAEAFVFNSNLACITPVPDLYVPNAFSPNGDGFNDVFRPYFSSPPVAEGFLLQIWDRWGGLIHQTADPLAGWDGMNEMQPVPISAYLYVLRYAAGDGIVRTRNGAVNLLR